MAPSHLRIYNGPTESAAVAKSVSTSATGKQCITVPLGEVLPLLADAVSSERTWLRDFTDDEMTISADLYEVLLAYQYFRRPSA